MPHVLRPAGIALPKNSLRLCHIEHVETARGKKANNAFGAEDFGELLFATTSQTRSSQGMVLKVSVPRWESLTGKETRGPRQ